MKKIIIAVALFMAGNSMAFAIDCGFGSGDLLGVGAFTGTPKTIYCYAFEYDTYSALPNIKSPTQLSDWEAIGYIFGVYNTLIAVVDRGIIKTQICRYKSADNLLRAIIIRTPDSFADTNDAGAVYLYTIFTDQGLCSVVNE